MCGRYTLKRKDRIAAFGKDILQVEWVSLTERFNVAPSQLMPVAVLNDEGKAVASERRWKVPPNARVEGITSKPVWADAVQRRRCLVPADGFYEWKKISDKLRRAHYFQLREGDPFFFAGMYMGNEYVILTTTPNAVVRPVHDRMPVILNVEAARSWLHAGPITATEIDSLCRPYPDEAMECWAVNKGVGNPRNEGPDCIVPWAPEPEVGFLPGLDLNSA